MNHPMTVRRAPVQARSRARVDAILDAADAVFLEMGYPAATTNHVAARAGTSIGSLYRFFPDKDALLVALAERYAARMQAIAASVTPDPGGRTIASLVARGIDTFNAFLVANPGFRTLIDEARHPALREGRARHEAAIAAMMRASQGRLATGLSDAELDVMVEVQQVVLGALQALSVSRDEAFRVLVVAETKRMVTGWLAARLGVPADVPVGPSEG